MQLLLLRRRLRDERERLRDHAGRVEVDENLRQLAIERPRLRGVERRKFLDAALHEFIRRTAMPGNADFNDAQLEQLLIFRQRCRGEFRERGEDVALIGSRANAREGEHGGERGVGIRLGEGFGFPLADGLRFDGDARGVADETVAAAQVRPRRGESLWILFAVKGFE